MLDIHFDERKRLQRKLGFEIQQRRLKLEWDRDTLAQLSGVSCEDVEKVEQGEDISPHSLERIQNTIWAERTRHFLFSERTWRRK
ncbi:MAG: hypothetical protein JXR73_11750 [Candidatus Omnitrophica bacterium]|nr:hypothetical protein [Candidatus Omnitrophota bacterium]